MGPKEIKLIPGSIYGYLTVIKELQGRHYPYLCKCICGKERNVLKKNLKGGHTISCGCKCKRSYKHGYCVNKTSTNEYKIWKSMNSRCYYSGNKHYHLYGGRGIRVCDRWRFSFENFLSDMGNKPPKLSLDRFPDKNGDYSPENCRWATQKQQMNNVRQNVVITYDGITQSQSDWCKQLKKGSGFFTYHLKSGKSIDEIMQLASKSQITHIYIMKSSKNGLYKIGRSTNPNVRIYNVRKQNRGIKIKLIFTSPPTHFKNEKIIHTFFKEKKHSGEWFRLNTDDILLVKNFFKSENQPSL